MDTTCREVQEWLTALVEADVSAVDEAAAARVRAHLAGCHECQKICRDQARLRQELRHLWNQTAPPGGWEELRNRLR